MNWITEAENNTAERIDNAGNHLIAIPAQNTSAPIDTFDIFDGSTHQIIAVNCSEKVANDFITMWNGLIDSNNKDSIAHVNLAWLAGLPPRLHTKVY
jgi:hypothetical protein